MADVYYSTNEYIEEIGREALVYSNSKIDNGYDLWYFDPDNPISNGELIWIKYDEVTNKFVFPENASGLFYGAINECFNGTEPWDTSECTDMSYLFYGCTNLKNKGYYQDPELYPTATEYSLRIEQFDTSNVTDMSHMFEECINLENFDLRFWDTSKVTNMSYMFAVITSDHSNVKQNSINVSYFDTSNVTNMSHMFYGFGSTDYFHTIDVDSFDFSKVEDISYMLSLTHSGGWHPNNWDLSSCTDATRLFAGSHIYEMDITDLDISNMDCTQMFSDCHYLNTVYLGEFDLSSTTSIDGMFYYCRQLESVYAAPGTDWSLYPQFPDYSTPFEYCENLHNWDGDSGLTNANNTKAGGFFMVEPKRWKTGIIYMKV